MFTFWVDLAVKWMNGTHNTLERLFCAENRNGNTQVMLDWKAVYKRTLNESRLRSEHVHFLGNIGVGENFSGDEI